MNLGHYLACLETNEGAQNHNGSLTRFNLPQSDLFLSLWQMFYESFNSRKMDNRSIGVSVKSLTDSGPVASAHVMSSVFLSHMNQYHSTFSKLV